jgi:hypothetical protein
MSDTDLIDDILTSIDGINTMTIGLLELREARLRFVREFGTRRDRETFAELDAAADMDSPGDQELLKTAAATLERASIRIKSGRISWDSTSPGTSSGRVARRD